MRRARTAGGRPKDRGAAAVEFALIVPILVLLVVGIAEFGRAYNIQSTLSGAAREGVRVMALKDSPSQARSTVKAYAPGLGLTDSQIAVTPVTCLAGGNATVTVTYPFKFLTGLLGADRNLTGRAVMRCNG